MAAPLHELNSYGARLALVELDGLGQPLDPDGDYYLQDARVSTGNCATWWRAEGKGYCCDLDDAGVYKGRDCSKRETDVPWPAEWVRARVVKHVRADLFPPTGRSRS